MDQFIIYCFSLSFNFHTCLESSVSFSYLMSSNDLLVISVSVFKSCRCHTNVGFSIVCRRSLSPRLDTLNLWSSTMLLSGHSFTFLQLHSVFLSLLVGSWADLASLSTRLLCLDMTLFTLFMQLYADLDRISVEDFMKAVMFCGKCLSINLRKSLATLLRTVLL